MALTVFYSWQSDLPSKVNRSFIEDALKKAIKIAGADLEVTAALRDEEFKLDKDTKGIPGTPPIADVIFGKITECAIYVADISCVARTEGGRAVPNPNVMMEYGWALKALTDTRIIAIMNEVSGKAAESELPFNLRHRRWPIRYNLSESAPSGDRNASKDVLVKKLADAIKDIVTSGVLEVMVSDQSASSEIRPTYSPAVFFALDEPLLIETGHRGGETEYRMSGVGAKRFLRLVPIAPAEALSTTQARELAQGVLEPLRSPNVAGGVGWGVNRYGAIAYSSDNTAIKSLTELHKNKEIWGVDVTPVEWRHDEFGFSFFAPWWEHTFKECLRGYLEFTKSHLQIEPRIKMIVGFSNVEKFRMAAPKGMTFGGRDHFGGRCMENDISYSCEIDGYDLDPKDVLAEFFEQVWDACGLRRPEKPN